MTVMDDSAATEREGGGGEDSGQGERHCQQVSFPNPCQLWGLSQVLRWGFTQTPSLSDIHGVKP